MEMKYYNPSNNFSAPIPREPKPYVPPRKQAQEVLIPLKPQKSMQDEKDEKEERTENPHETKLEQMPFATDELIIMGVILVLIMNQCDDYLLLLILGYLLLSAPKNTDKCKQ